MRAPCPVPTLPVRRARNTPPYDLIRSTLLCLAALCVTSFAGELPLKKANPTPTVPPGIVIQGVRTTAYTHTEGDHLEYGARSATVTKERLKFSAACR